MGVVCWSRGWWMFLQASAQFFTRSDQTVTFRVAVVMEDDSILLFSGGGHAWGGTFSSYQNGEYTATLFL